MTTPGSTILFLVIPPALLGISPCSCRPFAMILNTVSKKLLLEISTRKLSVFPPVDKSHRFCSLVCDTSEALRESSSDARSRKETRKSAESRRKYRFIDRSRDMRSFSFISRPKSAAFALVKANSISLNILCVARG